MRDYPEVVAKIADDYVVRVRSQLSQIPIAEREEFLREIESHLYEAYQQTPVADEVARILTVLHHFGEPSDIVGERFPEAAKRPARNGPRLYATSGLLLAACALLAGLGGAAASVPVLLLFGWALAAYYVATGAVLLSGGLLMLLGLVRMGQPELWNKLVAMGALPLSAPLSGFSQLPGAEHGLLLLFTGVLVVAAGWGMLRLGARFFRTFRSLYRGISNWVRRCAHFAWRQLAGSRSEGFARLRSFILQRA